MNLFDAGVVEPYNLIDMNANMLNRRNVLKGLAAAAVAGPMLPGVAQAAKKGSPKRVIFFMQNQGFDPATAIPAGMKNSGSLAKVKLPEPIQALEPYKERLQIINGLHGTHTSPSHSPFFGALVAIAAATACRRVDRRLITR